MTDSRQPEEAIPRDDPELSTVPTTAEDIASAGRSCMAILLLLAVIVVVLGIWVVARSTGMVQ
jgi:hypothetical protein